MDLKQILFDGMSAEMNRNAEKIVAKTIKQAEEDGYQVTFIGEYRQATIVEGSLEMPVPFVVAQTTEQAAKLAEGTIEGRVYDMGRYASVNGRVDSASVEFEKKYDPRSISLSVRRLLAEIRNVLTPEHKHLPILNPATIIYSGQSADEGKVYTGEWSFNYKPSNMATKGSFTMCRNN